MESEFNFNYEKLNGIVMFSLVFIIKTRGKWLAVVTTSLSCESKSSLGYRVRP